MRLPVRLLLPALAAAFDWLSPDFRLFKYFDTCC
jgi:hypothetical protein